jgi:hypothetical protein
MIPGNPGGFLKESPFSGLFFRNPATGSSESDSVTPSVRYLQFADQAFFTPKQVNRKGAL